MASDDTNNITEEDLIPRDYQIELMNRALEENTIIYLPTGAGKTFIAILILKRLAGALENSIKEGGKISVILVNTVALVDQHTTNLKRHTPFKIGAYSGEMNVDYWSKEKWIEECETYQVLVMTAQIFLNIITSSFLSLENVNLIIFDECHHAVCDHTMRQLMKQFQDVNEKPRVVGLTATLLNRNCKIQKVLEEVKKLEITYQSKVATVSEIGKVVSFSTNPIEKVISYKQYTLNECEINAIKHLEGLIDSLSLIEANPNKDKKDDDLIELESDNKIKIIINFIQDIIIHIKMLGTYGGKIALIVYAVKLEQMRRHATDAIINTAVLCTITALEACIRHFNKFMEHSKNKIFDYSSPKVKLLINILKEYKKLNKDMFGIIFVQRRCTSKILYHILKELQETNDEFNFIIPEFIMGYQNNPHVVTRASMYLSKMNNKILDSFANCDINLLIATNVIEEGIDVPRCKFVCKFDEPKDYRSYIQSKGRGRHKDSLYYIMISDADLSKFTQNYANFKDTEQFLNEYLMGQNDVRLGPSQDEVDEIYEEEEVPPYFVNGPGSACVNMLTAISLLCRYCQTLNSDLYTVQQPKWYLQKRKLVDKYCKVIIELPTICPIIAPVQAQAGDKKTAKRKAALQACILLHKCGELDENLMPIDRTILENVEYLFEHWPKENEKPTVTNAKKRRNHKKEIPKCTVGLIDIDSPVYLHVIDIKPQFDKMDSTKSTMFALYDSELTFGLISSNKFPRICEFPVYVTQGEIHVNLLVNYKTVKLDKHDLELITTFNFVIFNDLLKILKTFLLIDLNNETNKVFCVPINKNNNYAIDFGTMQNHGVLKSITELTSAQRQGLVVNDDTFLHKIVTPWYRSEDINHVVKEVTDMTSNSRFPSENIMTFAEYYKTKYDITIINQNQSLLLVKAVSSRLNCIKPRGVSKSKRKELYNLELEDIHLIPELCVKQDFPSCLWIQATILPTILERIYQMFLCEDLREKINREANIGSIAVESWKPLNLHYYQHYKENVPETVPPIMNMAVRADVEIIKFNSSKLNNDFKSKMLEKQYPWLDSDEPIDIERSLKVNLLDIEEFENFMSAKLTTTQRECRNNVQYNTLSIEYRKDFVDKKIASISNEGNIHGPELKEIFEALCTAKANDIVNLERYETLGDSFLKIIVSLYVILKFPKYDEGKATILKSKIISNKNLYYLGVKKNLGGILKSSDFEPRAQWIPPGFTIPIEIKTAYESKEFIGKHIHNVSLHADEQLGGVLFDETLEYISSSEFKTDDGYAQEDQSSMYFFGSQEVADKTIADVVEALLGVYYKTCGLTGGIKLLQWFDIIPKTENILDLLKSIPPSPILSDTATKADIDFHIPFWKQLETRLGYKFNNRAYLLQALTHSSYSPNRITTSYERLEFIGDAVLDFLITSFIYEYCGNLNPGQLTDLRSALVNNITFACYTVRCEFHKFLLSLNRKLENDIDKFVLYQENNGFAVTDNVLILLNENDIHIAENVDCPKILGDIFEALAGAVYLDCGMDLNVVWDVFYKIMWQEIDRFSKDVPKNVVRLLHETPGSHPRFHNPIPVDRTMMVKLDFMMNGSLKRVYGFGENKKLAKKAAAKIALRVMGG